jgi:predicted transcriptional regulator
MFFCIDAMLSSGTLEADMARVTINLPDELHRALKAAAARRGRTIGSMVAESLEAYGIKSRSDAAALVERARTRARLSEDEALELAIRETSDHRSL